MHSPCSHMMRTLWPSSRNSLPQWIMRQHETKSNWGRVYKNLTTTPKALPDHQNKERQTNCHSQEESKETRRRNVTWDPGWDSGTVKHTEMWIKYGLQWIETYQGRCTSCDSERHERKVTFTLGETRCGRRGNCLYFPLFLKSETTVKFKRLF